MPRFIDAYLPDSIPGYPAYSEPRFSTDLTITDGGVEQANQRWQHPLHTFSLPEGVRDITAFLGLRDHWLVMRGPAHTFPFRDPLDFASAALTAPNTVPTITALDQIIGTGDGVTKRFQLIKTYSRGGQTYVRNIKLPVTASVLVSDNGVSVGGWTVSRQGGVIEFATAPIAGHLIRAGYLFDVPVRFESDDTFSGIVKTFGISGFSDLTLVEWRPCEFEGV